MKTVGNFKLLEGYKKRWLGKDILAGVTVAAVTIPVAMGYAQIAGLPPVYGMYASILPALLYVLFASSRRIIFGTDAVIASMIAAVTLGILNVPSGDLPAMTALLAIVIGGFFLLFWLLRLGGVTRYLSKPTMSGFISGLAITILVSQLPKMMDLSVDTEHGETIQTFIAVISNLGQANFTSVILAAIALAVLATARKLWPRIPMAIVVLVLFTILTAGFELFDRGVGIVGEVPQGLPGFSVPDLGLAEFSTVLAAGFAISVVVFADSLLTARSFALRRRDPFDDNKELRGVGVANVIGGFFGAMPGSASASRAAAAESAGMRTQLTQVVTAAIIALVLLFFNNLLFYIPTPVLATIVFVAVATLVDVVLLKTLFKRRRRDFWIMIATIAAVIIIGILPAVLFSVFLSMADFFLRSSAPPQAMLGKIPGHDGYFDLRKNKRARSIEGVAIYRFGAPLFFANYGIFTKKVADLADQKDTKAIVVAADAITDIDSTAADGLKDLAEQLRNRKVPLYFAGLTDAPRHQIESYNIDIPKTHVLKTIDDALKQIKGQKV